MVSNNHIECIIQLDALFAKLNEDHNFLFFAHSLVVLITEKFDILCSLDCSRKVIKDTATIGITCNDHKTINIPKLRLSSDYQGLQLPHYDVFCYENGEFYEKHKVGNATYLQNISITELAENWCNFFHNHQYPVINKKKPLILTSIIFS